MASFLDDTHAFMYDGDKPQTLCDWVKNFRLKKIQMKRKYRHSSNLRVCAMLTTALHNAEDELKRKQQERFNKWAEMQSKIGYYNNNYSQNFNIDNSFNNINSNNTNNYYNYNNSSCASEVRSSYSYYSEQNHDSCSTIISDEDLQHQQRDTIDNLWKSELSGLDQFMKNMSSRCSITT